LQVAYRNGDRDKLMGFAIHDHADQLSDFADTAALISLLDLVITVDTAVAHLAAALGKPVWLMLPFIPDYRWLLRREDSPWYPSMRLFRQDRLHDWAGVVTRVAGSLSGMSGAS
jgi:Glycosyltransferase family 9 (heptosyltransferase)